jgi:TonB-linked SusC/RagA family outer membrane protein
MELSVLCKALPFNGLLPTKTLRKPAGSLVTRGFLRKALKIMRMTSVIILAISLHVSADTYSQKISINSRDISLEKVFDKLNQQSGYSFFWNDQGLSRVGHVNINIKNATLREAMDVCLAGTDLTYTVEEKSKAIFITPRPPASFIQPEAAVLLINQPIHGVVKDSSGNALDGASVLLKSATFSKGTATDKSGHFILADIPEGTYTLTVSSVGYGAFQRRVTVNSSTPELSIILRPTISNLDETVVIGYGTQKRRELTASVSTVPMDKIAEIASPSINDELGGRMPGVFISTDGGGPGQQASIFVRGGNGGNNPPLFVIDGFIRSEADYVNLNPNDVESFVVLKDAEATAVYGAQGGNGVVLVTTKKGHNGVASFNYTFNQIWTQPTILPKMLNSYDKASAIDQVYLNAGLTPPYADSVLQYYKDQTKPYNYPNTNWRKLLLKNFAHEERHDFSVSGGNDALRYYAGLSYYHQGSIIKTDNNYNDRVTYRLNVENNLKKIGLKITTGVDGYVNSNVQPSSQDGGYEGIFSQVVNQSPMNLAVNQYGLPYSGISENPLTKLIQAGYIKNNQRTFNGVLSFDWTVPFIKGLHLKANGNYNMYNTMYKNWNATGPGYDLGSTSPEYTSQPTLTDSAGDGSTWDLQGVVAYNRSFGKHNFAFTGVYEQIQGKSEMVYAERQSYVFPIDQFFAGPTANQVGSGYAGVSASEGYVGRLQYNYADKYFLEGSLRYDGSYLFPPNKRFGLFYGFSGGWILTEENFMHFLKDDKIFDFLKVRASYGLVGSTNGITPYAYLPTYNIQPNSYVVGGQPQSGLSENQLPSSAFTWYNNSSTNVGVDFATLHNRLSGSFDYFYTSTSGFVISDTAYSATLGQKLPYVNSNASQRTAGYEVALNWSDKAGAFSYRIGVTYSNYATLYPLYPGENSTQIQNPYTRQSGKTDNYYNPNNTANAGSGASGAAGANGNFNNGLGYVATGVYGSNAAALNGPLLSGSTNVAGGDIRYQDENGDGQVNVNDQRLIGSNNFAHTNYGFNFSLGYKGWSLDAAFMGTGNRDIMLGSIIQGNSPQGILVYPYQLNYWTPANTGAAFPRQLPSTAYNGNNNNQTSNYWLVNARYIRLRSLNLSYDLKTIGFMRRVPFTQCKVFVTGRNLLTISNTTKYYLDPESDPSGYGYGVQRTFALGCNLGF